MTNLKDILGKLQSSGKLAAIGMVWYEASDYPEILRIMADGNLMPTSHADWQRKAEQQEQTIKNQGYRVIRAVVKPKDFRVWCMARGHNVDAQGRIAFANEQAARQAGII